MDYSAVACVISSLKQKSNMNRNTEFIKTAKQMQSDMIDEHGYLFCEHCGVNGNSSPLDPPHHIIFRSEKPKHPKLHSRENLIILCRSCHNKFHANKTMRNDLVRKR